MEALDRKIARIRRAKEMSDKEINEHRKYLSTLRDQVIKEITKTSDALSRAELLNKKFDEALDATREELETARKITIPGLVEANEVLHNRWAAENAVLARQKALIEPREID